MVPEHDGDGMMRQQQPEGEVEMVVCECMAEVKPWELAFHKASACLAAFVDC